MNKQLLKDLIIHRYLKGKYFIPAEAGIDVLIELVVELDERLRALEAEAEQRRTVEAKDV